MRGNLCRLLLRTSTILLVFAWLLRAGSLSADTAIPNANYFWDFSGNCFGCSLQGGSPFHEGDQLFRPFQLIPSNDGYFGTNIDTHLQTQVVSVSTGLNSAPIPLSKATTNLTINPSPGALFGGSTAAAFADIVYDINVVSKTNTPPTVVVPIDEIGFGTVDCSASGQNSSVIATSTIFIGNTLAGTTNCVTGPGTAENTFRISNVTQFPANQIITVNIISDVEAGCSFLLPVLPCSASGKAFTDPSFQIDPSFQFANDFTLEYSPNFVPTTPSVPEPASALLLLSGLGIVGLGLKRASAGGCFSK